MGLAKAKAILEKRGYTLQELLGGNHHSYSQAEKWVDIEPCLEDSLDGERHD